MLFKPVYIRAKMREAPIHMGTPATSTASPAPPPTPPPPPTQSVEGPRIDYNREDHQHMPVLVYKNGVHVVYPTEARRDVLAGRVAYVYVDDAGFSVFQPKHMFTALKLNRLQKKKYEDYPCIGAHQRLFRRKPIEKSSFKSYRVSVGFVPNY